MVHALRYHGDYHLNFATLSPGATTYTSTSGDTVPLEAFPGDVDGVRFSWMERRGGKCVVVRVQFEAHDVVLPNDVPLDTERHLGWRRLGRTPTPLTDALASTLLDDLIAQNPERSTEIALLLNRVNQVRRSRREGSAGPGAPPG